MSSELDTVIAVTGFISFLVGIFLWLGLPATLIVFGLAMVFIGVRMRSGDRSSLPEPKQPANIGKEFRA